MAFLNYSFAGKRVLVTGGASGIGLATVQRFYADGAEVFVLDRDQAQLGALKKKLPRVTTICVDLLQWAETKKAVEALAPLDHLVNNAGIIGTLKPLLENTPEDFDVMFGINVKAILNVSQAFVKGIVDHKKTEGSRTIVNLSSIAATNAAPGAGIYSASKAAVSMLTKSMAIEFGEYGIRVNCVCPGAVPSTNLFHSWQPGILDQAMSGLASRVPIKQQLVPEDITNAVLFLSSALSSKVTAVALTVDCGFQAT